MGAGTSNSPLPSDEDHACLGQPTQQSLTMTDVLGPCLLNFMPLIVTASGWAKAYQTGWTKSLHPFAFALLAVVHRIRCCLGRFLRPFLVETGSLPSLAGSRSYLPRMVIVARPTLHGGRPSCLSQRTQVALLDSRRDSFLVNRPRSLGCHGVLRAIA